MPMDTALEIHQFACLNDNYGVLIHDPEANTTASIDAPDAAAVEAALAEKSWSLTHILTTHHHADHTGGNLALKEAHGCTIVGPKREQDRIPGIDTAVGEGETVKFGNHTARIYETPGHTAGHISYWFEDAGVAFVGDTLFALGCGRLFEGTAEQMWSSLQKIMQWPDDTVIYAGHEYTLANAAFALAVDPENAALQERATDIRAARDAGRPTLPTTLSLELATNPFLRATDPGLRAALDLPDAEDWEVFAEVRRRKDNA